VIREEYNANVTTNENRKASDFLLFFQGLIELPDRPCVPDQPVKYNGPDLQWADDWSTI